MISRALDFLISRENFPKSSSSSSSSDYESLANLLSRASSIFPPKSCPNSITSFTLLMPAASISKILL